MLLVGVDERARPGEARRRVDDLVAVHLAAAALELVLRVGAAASPVGPLGRVVHRRPLCVRDSATPQDLTYRVFSGCGTKSRLTREPPDDRQDVHLGERPVVGLGPVRPARRRGTRAPGRCACRPRTRRRRRCVRRSPTNSARSGSTPSSVERALEDRRVRLPHSPTSDEKSGEVEPLGDAELLEVPVQEPAAGRSRSRRARAGGPRSRSESSSACVVDAELPRRLPGGVLRLEEPRRAPRRRPRRPTSASELARRAPGSRPPRASPAAAAAAGRPRGTAPVKPGRGPARPSAREARRVPRVEQRPASHAQRMSVSPQSKRTASSTAGRVRASWRRGSSGRRSPSRPSRSRSTAGRPRGRRRSSSSRPRR